MRFSDPKSSGFDKLGLPYYMPGWQQPSAVLDFLMRR